MEPTIDINRIHQETLFSQTFYYLEKNCASADRMLALLSGKIHMLREIDFNFFDQEKGIAISRFLDDVEKLLHVFESFYKVLQDTFFPEIEDARGLGVDNQIGFEQIRFSSVLNNLEKLSDGEFFALMEEEIGALHHVVEENLQTLAHVVTQESLKERKILLKDVLAESYLAGLSGAFLVDAIKKWTKNKLKNNE